MTGPEDFHHPEELQGEPTCGLDCINFRWWLAGLGFSLTGWAALAFLISN